MSATTTNTAAPFRMRILGMDCSECAMTIEDAIRKIDGVETAQVNFTTEVLEGTGTASEEKIAARVRQLGYKVNDGSEPEQASVLHDARGLSGFFRFVMSQSRTRNALFVTIALFVMIGLTFADVISGEILSWGFIAATVISGAPFVIKGLRSLFLAQRITIDILVGLAAIGAIIIGEPGEAATVALLFTLGEALEAYSAERARDSLRSLFALQPQEAIVLREHVGGHGEEEAAHDHSNCGGDHGHDHSGHDHGKHEHKSHNHEHAHGESCSGHDHDSHDHKHDSHNHAHDHGHDHKHGESCSGHDHASHDHKHDSHNHAHDHGHNHKHGESCSGHDHDHGHSHSNVHAMQRPVAEVKKVVHEPHDHQHVMNVAEVAIGERILVRPGQRVPLDGVVLKGESALDQSPVTGESIPVHKTVGDEVLAGSVNSDAALEIRVTRASSDSTISRIARLVEQAQSQRSPAEKFIDKFARWYTPLVVVIAALIAFLPPLLFNAPLWETAEGHGWLYRGLALLIVACPCALVISIPVTVVSSLTRLAQLGVLVKGGEQLDRLADVTAVAFDKTGTLTQGRPVVTALRGIDCTHADSVATECASCDEVIALAAAIEKQSEHPIAHAIVNAAGERQVAARYGNVDQVKAIAGRGITGLINSQKVAVGSLKLVADNSEIPGQFNGKHFDAAHKTLVYVGRDDVLVGVIGVEDTVRSDSSQALSELHAINDGMKTIMLTGDNRGVAEKIARQLGGIDEVHAELLPEDKLSQISRLQERYGRVAMIGDGINDAPALAKSDVGIAMGAGTAQAMETADVVLMQDDLLHVSTALRFGHMTRKLIKQNILLSLGLKVAFLALAVPGFATLWMAVLADVGATLLVTLNGMRMVREK
jgi:Cd2+/Zn2+-exporting ATPase